MNDDELDRWLLVRTEHLTERLHTSIDIEERLRDTLTATKRPSHRMHRYAAAVAAAASVLLVFGTLFTANMPDSSQTTLRLDPVADQPPALTSTLEYQQVTGPAGLQTVVPHGWTMAATPGPGTVQFVDPENSRRFVRLGGLQVTVEDLLAVHEEYEATFASGKTGYERIDWSPTTFHGVEALRWEFVYDTAPEHSGKRHVAVLYWHVGDHEYFIYGSAPDDEWSEMAEILASMLGYATP